MSTEQNKTTEATPPNSEMTGSDATPVTFAGSRANSVNAGVEFQEVNPEFSVFFSDIKNSNLEGVKEFLAKGIDLNFRFFQTSPLVFAASVSKGGVEIAKALLDAGADVSFQPLGMGGALHRACLYNNVELAELFVARGADVNASTQNTLKPLDFANYARADDCILFLSSKGAKASDSIDLEQLSVLSGRSPGTSRAEFLAQQASRQGAEARASIIPGQLNLPSFPFPESFWTKALAQQKSIIGLPNESPSEVENKPELPSIFKSLLTQNAPKKPFSQPK